MKCAPSFLNLDILTKLVFRLPLVYETYTPLHIAADADLLPIHFIKGQVSICFANLHPQRFASPLTKRIFAVAFRCRKRGTG